MGATESRPTAKSGTRCGPDTTPPSRPIPEWAAQPSALLLSSPRGRRAPAAGVIQVRSLRPGVEHHLRMPTEPPESADAGPPPHFDTLPAELGNGHLLSVLDRVLLELEQRMLRYARTGPEILEMAG